MPKDILIKRSTEDERNIVLSVNEEKWTTLNQPLVNVTIVETE